MNQIGLVEAAGIVVVLALVAWQIVFFQVVRPRIMARIGRRLQVNVHESVGPWDAGVFNTEDGTPVRKTVSVALADFVVILVGVVGVIAAVAVPLLLLAQSGLPFRWEGQLTGTAVRIGEIIVPPISDKNTTARVTVRSEAREAMRACRLSVAGYTARNGYLTGASNYFDLEPANSNAVEFTLSVMTRNPGTHRFRLNLECSNRLRDSARASVEVLK